MGFRALLLCLLVAWSCFGCTGLGAGARGPTSSPAAGETTTDGEKTFAEVTKGLEKLPGLFDLYWDAAKGKAYMALAPDQIGKVYVMVPTIVAGDGYVFDSGSLYDAVPIVFERHGGRIYLVERNLNYRADEGAVLREAVRRGISDAIHGTGEILAAPEPETGALLVNLADLFLTDYFGVAQRTEEGEIPFTFDAENSYVAELHNYPKNTEIAVEALFTSRRMVGGTAGQLQDSRSMRHRYNYSLVDLPVTTYRPRLADDRVGYFTVLYKDYTDLTRSDPYVRMITRWHLEKADPSADLSEPVQPIVFWIDKATPVAYRKAVREGIEMWNQAFEKIGFKNAIVVKQQPDDATWQAADVRYNTVVWFVRDDSTYAVGPSVANPFSGEIFAADVRIGADFIRWLNMAESDDLDVVIDSPSPAVGPGVCTYGFELAQVAAEDMALLDQRGTVVPGSARHASLVNDEIRALVAHEIGHTLGLRHNFAASTAYDLADLAQGDQAATGVLAASVMDYIPFNVAAEGEPQGPLSQLALGPYDFWAIEYGYRVIEADDVQVEGRILGQIAARGSQSPALRFATDEDATDSSMDPSVNRHDLGREPLEFAARQLANGNEYLRKVADQFERRGERYAKVRSALRWALRRFHRAVGFAAKYIGGVHLVRDHPGDGSGRVPLTPVPADKQRAALTLLMNKVFAPDAFNFSADLLRRAAPERLGDFDGRAYLQPYHHVPVHKIVLDVQTRALDRILDPLVLTRMSDVSLMHRQGEDAFGLDELFATLRRGIWRELDDSSPTAGFRRNLQRAHLSRLIDLAIRPQGRPYFDAWGAKEPAGHVEVPEDARSLARRDLRLLRDQLGKRLRAGLHDPLQRAHVEESIARIDAALEARFSRDS